MAFLLESVIVFVHMEHVHHYPDCMQADVTPSCKRTIARNGFRYLCKPNFSFVLQLEDLFCRRDIVHIHHFNLYPLGHLQGVVELFTPSWSCAVSLFCVFVLGFVF